MNHKKLSDSFAGQNTKTIGKKQTEIEMKKLDVFTDEFSPPGTGESSPGAVVRKVDLPFETKHDDIASSEPEGKPFSPVSQFDKHQTDPMKLMGELRKDLRLEANNLLKEIKKLDPKCDAKDYGKIIVIGVEGRENMEKISSAIKRNPLYQIQTVSGENSNYFVITAREK